MFEHARKSLGFTRGAWSSRFCILANFGRLLNRLTSGFLRGHGRDIGFLGAFLFLHLLLFLPIVLMDREDGTILPNIGNAGGSLGQTLRLIFFWRRSPDLLRLNSEIILFVALWAWLPPLRKSKVRYAFVSAYLFAFGYYIYEGASITFFGVEPVIYSQFRLATEGLSFFVQNARVTSAFLAAILILLLASALLVARLSKLALSNNGPGALPRILLALLTVVVLFQASTNLDLVARTEMVFSSLSAKLYHNFVESRRVYANVQSFESELAHQAYDYSAYSLAQRPPVYIIFVESYGTVLYKRPDWRAGFQALTQRLDKKLADGGWHIASARSLAPTWGGGSWMSYTSALFGLLVSSDPQYYALLDKYNLEEYPDLGRFLKDQGYRYYRLTALSMGLLQSDWGKYARFYGVERWIQYEDLDYHGPEYGWGPAPPDQFSLNFSRETIRQETDDPFLFFTITQNSHYPWTPQPELVHAWEELNRPGEAPPPSSEMIEHSERRRNYWRAIEYQLEMLTDFIVSEPDDDAIFVIVGDHQPPRVSRREDGWDTPMHIIAKDGDFIASFKEYGFANGLAVWEPEPTFRHEGFFSLLVRLMLAAYGDGGELPPFLPEGIIFQNGPTESQANPR